VTQISETRRLRLSGLWKDSDFLKLWGGQAVSELGSRITRDGIPFAALLVLNATRCKWGSWPRSDRCPYLREGWRPAFGWTAFAAGQS